MSDPRSAIPSIDALLGSPDFAALLAGYPRARVVEGARHAVAEARERLGRGDTEWDVASSEPYARAAAAFLVAGETPSLRRVINATGVVLHTNLGRAPLADVAVEAMVAAAKEYTNLEYDVEAGERGSRYTHCVSLLTELTGAEGALVVNNAAAALVLALNTLARGEGVAVSRGELVEIGGGFRIPDVLERSGARLVEVGSTNRTRAADYEAAMDEGTVPVVLKVHRSNFRITGFTESAGLSELAEIAARKGATLVHDLGSGLMLSAEQLGLPGEPRPHDSLAEGAELVTFSGDKLFGGPQAGIIVGRAELIGRMRSNPLCRALRVDKGTLAALEATLRLYRDPERAIRQIPTLRMLSAGADELRERAERLAAALTDAGVACAVAPAAGAVGGGTFPDVELPSWGVELSADSATGLAATLRAAETPIIGRIVDDRVILDVRTVLPHQEEELVGSVTRALAK